MIYAGKNIMDPTDRLSKITVEYLYRSLTSPKPTVEAQIRQLKAIREIDPKRYNQMKRRLPYIVTNCFAPLIRNSQNYAYSEFILLDIDELSSKGLEVKDVRERLYNDPRILLMFVSQGGDGLKLLFQLNERCYDEGLYNVFIKEFARRFFERYNISQFVDNRRSDVTYSCYISIDAEAYYNSEAIPVDMAEVIDKDNPVAFFDLKSQQEKEEKLYQKNKKQNEQEQDHSIQDEELSQVKGILMGERYSKRTKRDVCIPHELENVMTELVPFIEDQGISVYEICNLNYAKKLKCRRGSELAELNLFYGRNGFNVVHSPRCCTSDELNDAVSEIIKVFLNSKN